MTYGMFYQYVEFGFTAKNTQICRQNINNVGN